MKYIELNNSMLCNMYYNMLNRCREPYQTKKPAYAGVTVCDEWMTDKYSFYDWVNDGQFYEIEGEKTVHLDKDILLKGNKVYAPDTCIFAPATINDFFGGTSRKQDNLPIGVIKVAEGKYKCAVKGIKDIFATPEEAWEIWHQHKDAQKIALADQYYGKIPNRLYEAMLRF